MDTISFPPSSQNTPVIIRVPFEIKAFWFLVGLAIGMCACLVAFIAVLWVMDASGNLGSSQQESPPTLQSGASAPDFELPALSGGAQSLNQYRGQPVLLSFGATWCTFCEKELPTLQRLHETHPELTVLLIDSGESMSVVQSYIAKKGVTFPVLVDEKRVATRRYKVQAFPTAFFIDGNGNIQQVQVGTMEEDGFRDALVKIGIGK